MFDLTSLCVIAHAFVASAFPFEGFCNFRLCYQLPSASETAYCLYFYLKHIEAEKVKCLLC
jgi:hypothetical protein